MGCGNSSSSSNVYTKENIFDKLLPRSSPVYVNNKVQNFSEIENKFMNETYIENVINSFQLFAFKKCLGYRKRVSDNELQSNFTFFTYDEVKTMAENFAHNLHKFKLACSKNYRDEGDMRMMGIYSRNCCEWILADLGCELDSITVVPLYDTLGQIAIEHIFKQTQLSTLCISAENIQKLLELKKKLDLESLKNIVVFDLTMKLNTQELEVLEKTGLTVYKFTDLIKNFPTSENGKYTLTLPKPESIVTICYTSGTTSLPKGAKISQRCINAQMIGNWDSEIGIDQKDVHLSYLPLAHIMERIGTSLVLVFGGAIGFISGDIRKYLMEDLKALKPTFFIAVPKVLANFRDNIYSKISKITGCKRSMIEKAIQNKKDNYLNSNAIDDSFYDTFVLSKIIDEFGGKWRFIITGSAPLAIELGIEIKIIFGCPVIEGYGMTELGGAVLCTNINDLDTGFVGGPLGTAKIRLEDCEELNYSSKTKKNDKTTPSGEICVKGPVCFSGYFRDKENTEKIFDKEGWLHTGDIGMLSTEQRKFKIIDRIKEIFKLNQGEYIAPSKLETVYSKCEYVSQICIYGQSLKTYIIGIITTKKNGIENFLKSKEWYKDDNVENYFENEELLKEIKRSLDVIADLNKFNSLEKVQKIIISKEEFTIENELLTPTGKVVRRNVEKRFKDLIDKVYN
jgi:long-chain acyl-CoA synthetase